MYAESPDRSTTIQAKAKILAGLLRGYTKREIEMLTRYYLNQEDERDIVADLGASSQEFSRLRERLRKSVGRECPTESARARSAAAG